MKTSGDPGTRAESDEPRLAVPIGATPSTTATLLAIMERQPRIDPSIIDELEQTIEAGKLPVRTEGVFDDLAG